MLPAVPNTLPDLPSLLRRARGLDLSSVQGDVDFGAIAAAGFDWVTLKATEGAGGTDPKFARYARDARAAGLLIDAYHFVTTGSAIADQIRHFASVALGIADLPPSIDFESPPPEKWLPPNTADALTKRAWEATQRTEDAFGRSCTYTYYYFGSKLPVTPELVSLVQRPLWIAWYPHERREPTLDEEPRIPEPWPGWMFWQWSGNGGLAAPGVSCVVDHDLFNGTRQELLSLLIPTSESFPGNAPPEAA